MTLQDVPDVTSRKRILSLHPLVRQSAIDCVCEATEAIKPALVRVTYGLRTFAEQDRLFNKKPPVTKARGGQSYHNYGLALDYCIMRAGKASWNVKADEDTDGVADWREIAMIFDAHGWEWGGEWNSFKDYPHVQFIPPAILELARLKKVRPWQVLLDKYNTGERDKDGYIFL